MSGQWFGVLGIALGALITGLFLLAGKRVDAEAADRESRRRAEMAAMEAAEEARRELLADKNARIDMLIEERDEARGDRDEARTDRDRYRRQVSELEALLEQFDRPTRGTQP